MVKTKYATLYIHPKSGDLLWELGRVDANSEMYYYDAEKKDFISLGFPQIKERVKLPRMMNFEDLRVFIQTSAMKELIQKHIK